MGVARCAEGIEKELKLRMRWRLVTYKAMTIIVNAAPYQ
jgi:hypothetical protein